METNLKKRATVRPFSSRRIYRSLLLGSIAVALMIAGREEGSAQIRVLFLGTHGDTVRIAGQWYDGSAPTFRTRYPALQSLPPAGEVDSLGDLYSEVDRMLRDDEAGDLISNRASHLGDTMLRRIASMLYRLTDFDPGLFAQYRDEVSARKTDAYTADLGGISEAIYTRIWEAARESNNALYSLLHADQILHVQILEVDSTVDAASPDYTIYQATATVIDTIKGRRFQSIAGAAEEYPLPQIRFQYTPLNYLVSDIDSRDRDEVEFIYNQTEPAFKTATGRFMMKPGQEAIIFLRHEDRLIDSSYDYYNLRLNPWASYNALLVEDGVVRDPNHIWSTRGTLRYEEWLARVMTLRERIVTGNL